MKTQPTTADLFLPAIFATTIGVMLCGRIHAAYTDTYLSRTPVAAGHLHSLALEAGRMQAWGFDWDGRLGTGESGVYSRPSPTPVVGLREIVAVAAGEAHSLALDREGKVWSWGQNHFGQLGQESATNRPVAISGLTGIVAVGAGFGHSLALDQDGQLWAWGRNDFGELGDGTVEPRMAPRRVAGLPVVRSIAAGANHSLAIDLLGRVWCWGDNRYGQLGNDEFGAAQPVPRVVTGLPLIMQAAAGAEHSLALDLFGQVWAWGRDLYGQLGNGTENRDPPAPILVPGLARVRMVAAGCVHSVAVDFRGAIWIWGGDDFGQLGDGTTRPSPIPVRVAGINDVFVYSAAGSEHTLTVTQHGQVRRMGRAPE